MKKNLATEKRELAEALQNHQTVNDGMADDALDRKSMTAKERRAYNRKQEKEKLAELTFWRKVQYILTYYTWKFLAVIAGCVILAFIGHQIYVATRPVALDIVLVNDTENTTFQDAVTTMYKDSYEVPDDALFLVDTNMVLQPKQDENYVPSTPEMAYYSKMLSDLTADATHIVISDTDVIDYYAVDGYVMELKHALPEDLFEELQEKGMLYECDGPVEDADYYAIDISGTEFVKETAIQLKHPYLFIPGSLTDENRTIAFNFIRMIFNMENDR